MKDNAKFVIEILSLLFIGIPIAIAMLIANELYWLVKKINK